MSRILTDNIYYSGIAGALREKLGVNTLFKPSEMAAAIASVPKGGCALGRAVSEGEILPAFCSSAEAELLNS